MSDLSAEVMKARIRIAKVAAQHDLLSDLLKRIEQRRQQVGFFGTQNGDRGALCRRARSERCEGNGEKASSGA
jgi:hypothetical protein